MDLDKVVTTYAKIRHKRAEIKKAYEAQDNELKAKLERLESFLLHHLNSTESESVRTESGTFYRQKDIMPSCSDWAAFHAWIKENDAFDALERRVKKTFITDYIEQHGDDADLPPGISTRTKYVVRVRRS